MTEERLRVYLTTELFYPELPGGLRQFARYGPGLKERGIQIEIHTTRRDRETPERLEIDDIKIVHHSVPELPDHHRERALLLQRALEEIRTARKSSPVCLQPNGMSWGALRTVWGARLRGIPSILYFTMFPETPPATAFSALKYRFRIRSLVSPFTKLLVCSKRMGAAYQEIASIPSERISVLPNGVSLENFTPVADEAEKIALRNRHNLPSNHQIVLYSGSLIPRKGTDILLEAWRRVAAQTPNATLVLLGSTGLRNTFRDPQLRTEFETFAEKTKPVIKELQESGSLIVTGEVDTPDSYYQAADIFVFPSRREGLPNAVLEAMASGLPCVLSSFAGIPDNGEEFGDHGTHHIRTSHEPDALARELLDLLGDHQRRHQIGTAARKLMEETQGLDRAVDSLAATYLEIAGQPQL